MEQFLQQILNGVFLGSIYALIALGYTMVYGVLRFINFAHGDVFMLGAFSGMLIHKLLAPVLGGLPWPVTFVAILLLSMAVCAAFGIGVEFLAYRPLRNRPRLNVLITAIGVSLFIEYTCQHPGVFGATQQPFPELIPTSNIEGLGQLTVTNTQIIVLFMAIALMIGLRFIVLKTKLGLAMRALSLNPTASALMGVNNSVVISFTFGLGSALAAAGGILYAALYPSIEPFMGVLPGLKAFVAAVLGGIGNIPGAALGGLLIGVTETLVAGYSQKMGQILPWIGFGIYFAVVIVMARQIFKTDQRQGWIVLLVPFAALVFACKNWATYKMYFMMAVMGLIFGIIGLRLGPAGIPSGYRDGVAFVVLILILLFKPSGLLGKVEREKV